MSVQTTKYVVWNNRENKVEAGPFLSNQDALDALRRASAKRQGSAKEALVLTVETVTSVSQK